MNAHSCCNEYYAENHEQRSKIKFGYLEAWFKRIGSMLNLKSVTLFK